MQPAGIRIQPIIRREPCAALVHGLALKEALALLPSGSVQNLSWQSMAMNGRAPGGPVTVECWQLGL